MLKLTENMRLCTRNQGTHSEDLKKFSEWILKIGDGKVGETNDGKVDVQLPHDLLIEDPIDPLEAIVETAYPDY